MKGKDPKKVNILEVNAAQYKYSKYKVNKIGDTLAKLSLPQNYDSTFLELKQREKQKTVHMNHKKKTYNKTSQKRSCLERSKAPKTLLLARTRSTMKC